ncbi:hypothetical protein L2U69_10590 [Zavarzinia compransoris]|uniref:hypothetical protein n=1 Tax=Zavarzinia marina TaxID=2911065 RepID=UPI001F1F4A4F|nr:hypothetical protein [Zavarzinia marina]MCF4166091.1 hypothetical protein [Zavarzinia marina]
MADSDTPQARLPRGAIPSPRWALAAARPFVRDTALAVPPNFLMWPGQLLAATEEAWVRDPTTIVRDADR